MLMYQTTQTKPQWLRLMLAMLGIFFFLGAVSPVFADTTTNSDATVTMGDDDDGPVAVSLSSAVVEAGVNSLMIFAAGFLMLSGLTLVAYKRKKEEDAKKRLQVLRVRRRQF